MSLLRFHHQIIGDLIEQDSLTVLGEGLGIHHVLVHFLRHYCSPVSLVLVIGTTLDQERRISDELAALNVASAPLSVTNEYNNKDRQAVYDSGGVLFVTSRILVVDILTKRLPLGRVSGLVLANAHRVTEASNEAFIIRLLRREARAAFVKALTDVPIRVSRGLQNTEKLMKWCGVDKLRLWPRVHLNVVEELDSLCPDVEEICVPLSHAQQHIQSTLMMLLEQTVGELGSALVEGDDLLTIAVQLPREATGRQRQLASDIRSLQRLLVALAEQDAVSFLTLLDAASSEEFRVGDQVPFWTLHPAARDVYAAARARVYRVLDGDERSASGRKRRRHGSAPSGPVLQVSVEHDSAAETAACTAKKIAGEVHGCVAVLVRDAQARSRVAALLTGRDVAAERLRRYLTLRAARAAPREAQAITNYLTAAKAPLHSASVAQQLKCSRDAIERSTESPAYDVAGTMGSSVASAPVSSSTVSGSEKRSTTAAAATTTTNGGAAVPCNVPQLQSSSASVGVDGGSSRARDGSAAAGVLVGDGACVFPHETGTIVVASTADEEECVALQMDPCAVVLVHCGLRTVRTVEIHAALRALRFRNDDNASAEAGQGPALRVVVLSTQDSAPEQAYLRAVEAEKQAIKSLVHIKEHLVSSATLSGEDAPAESTAAIPMRGRVVIDVREFRSALPLHCDAAGFDIVPVQLAVGDYVLSPQHVVERKSIPDLQSSLASGRLLQQAEAMLVHYAVPILLIEHEGSAIAPVAAELDATSPQCRLALLILHQPTLRILWSPHPSSSAHLFAAIKRDAEEPAIDEALAKDALSARSPAHALLEHLPGVGPLQRAAAARHGRSIADLCTMDEEALRAVLGSAPQARTFHAFVTHRV